MHVDLLCVVWPVARGAVEGDRSRPTSHADGHEGRASATSECNERGLPRRLVEHLKTSMKQRAAESCFGK